MRGSRALVLVVLRLALFVRGQGDIRCAFELKRDLVSDFQGFANSAAAGMAVSRSRPAIVAEALDSFGCQILLAQVQTGPVTLPLLITTVCRGCAYGDQFASRDLHGTGFSSILMRAEGQDLLAAFRRFVNESYLLVGLNSHVSSVFWSDPTWLPPAEGGGHDARIIAWSRRRKESALNSTVFLVNCSRSGPLACQVSLLSSSSVPCVAGDFRPNVRTTDTPDMSRWRAATVCNNYSIDVFALETTGSSVQLVRKLVIPLQHEHTQGFAFCDVTGDSLPELIVQDATKIKIFNVSGDTAELLSEPSGDENITAETVSCVDVLDRGSPLDLVACPDAFDRRRTCLVMLNVDGHGTEWRTQNELPTSTHAPLSADFDGDGRSELAVIGQKSSGICLMELWSHDCRDVSVCTLSDQTSPFGFACNSTTHRCVPGSRPDEKTRGCSIYDEGLAENFCASAHHEVSWCANRSEQLTCRVVPSPKVERLSCSNCGILWPCGECRCLRDVKQSLCVEASCQCVSCSFALSSGLCLPCTVATDEILREFCDGLRALGLPDDVAWNLNPFDEFFYTCSPTLVSEIGYSWPCPLPPEVSALPGIPETCAEKRSSFSSSSSSSSGEPDSSAYHSSFSSSSPRRVSINSSSPSGNRKAWWIVLVVVPFAGAGLAVGVFLFTRRDSKSLCGRGLSAPLIDPPEESNGATPSGDGWGQDTTGANLPANLSAISPGPKNLPRLAVVLHETAKKGTFSHVRELSWIEVSSVVVGRMTTSADLSCFALCPEGTVRCWGDNASGQLGLGTTEPFVKSPTLCEGLAGVMKVVSGGDWTAFLTRAGDVFTCGDNSRGTLGTGDCQQRLRPFLVQSLESKQCTDLAVWSDGGIVSTKRSVVLWWGGGVARSGAGALTATQVQCEELRSRRAESVSASESGVAVLVDGGTAVAWRPLFLEGRWTVVECGSCPLRELCCIGETLIALDASGCCVAVGDNSNGLLGTGDLINHSPLSEIDAEKPVDLSFVSATSVDSISPLKLVVIACSTKESTAAVVGRDGAIYMWGQGITIPATVHSDFEWKSAPVTCASISPEGLFVLSAHSSS